MFSVIVVLVNYNPIESCVVGSEQLRKYEKNSGKLVLGLNFLLVKC